MATIREGMQNKGKGDLQSDALFSTNMDELLSGTGNMSTVIRNSVNPGGFNPGQHTNIKKSIRGGAGSVYKKGPNQSVNLGDLRGDRGISLHLPPGESLH